MDPNGIGIGFEAMTDEIARAEVPSAKKAVVSDQMKKRIDIR